MLRSLHAASSAALRPGALALLGLSLLANCYFVGRWIASEHEVHAGLREDAAGSAVWLDERTLEWRLGAEFFPPGAPDREVAPLRPEQAPALEPALAGQWLRLAPRLLRFRAEQPVPRATRYRVRLGPDWTDRSGAPADGLALEFAWPGPRLRDVAVSLRGGREVELDLDFDAPVDLESLRSRLALVQGVDRAARLLELAPSRRGADRPRAVFELPEEPVSKSPSYRLELASGVASPLGELRGDAASFALNIERRLGYRRSEVFQHGEQFRVHASFSSPIDPLTARAFVSCEPVRELVLTRTWNGLAVSGGFAPGDRVRLRFEAGLASEDGRELLAPVDDWIDFPELAPEVEFASAGAVLLAAGRKELELSVVNVEELHLSAWRLLPNQIANWAREHSSHQFSRYLGEPAGELRTRPALVRNQPTRVALPLEGWLRARAADASLRGTYYLSARHAGSWREVGRVVTITDLAITARRSEREALLWVTEIGSGRPAAEVEVEVRSLRDQVLARGRTDERGTALLHGLDARAGDEAWIAFARRGDDEAFLELGEHGVASAADAAGRPWKRGADAFVFCERALARPGEELRFGGWLRDELGAVRAPLPLEVRLARGDGKVLWRERVEPSPKGWFEGRFTLASEARTGAHRLAVHAVGGGELGACDLAVEDFRPDRLKVSVALPAERLAPRELEVYALAKVERASGGPAPELRMQASLRFHPSAFRPPVDERFLFAPPLEARALPPPRELGEARADEVGSARFALELEQEPARPAPLEIEVVATAFEAGGRSVSGRARAALLPEGPYLALALPRGAPRVGAPLAVEIGAFDVAGAPVAMKDVELLVERIQRSWVLRRGRGGSAWEQVEEVVGRHAQLMRLVDGLGLGEFPAELMRGSVRWSVRAPSRSDVVPASGTIDLGAGAGESSPERIELVFEPPRCAPGEQVLLRARSPFSGTALLTLEQDGLVETRVLELAEGVHEIPLRIDTRWQPTLHASLSVVRAHPGGAQSARAVGRARLAVVPVGAPELALEGAARVRPGETTEIELRARGAAAGDEVALWAIDEAVLAMSGEYLPDPSGYFLGARRGLFETRDPFARLLPELGEELLRLDGAPGGDEEEPGGFLLRRQARPEREALLGAWLGRVALDAEGRARVALPASERSGRLRVVALLATDRAFARAERTLEVRDELELELALPGALAPRDRVEVPILLRTRELASAGPFALELRAEGALALRGPTRIEGELPRDGELTLWCALEANAAREGVVPSRLLASVAVGRITREARAATVVRRPDAPQSRRGALLVSGTERFAPADELEPLPGGFELELSLAPWLGLAPALRELIAYPWGCLEQILSRARPLLEIEALAAVGALDELDGERARQIVDETLRRLGDYAAGDGGLALWPGSGASYGWGSVQALDFALAARARGHAVDEALLRGLVAWCERHAALRVDELERCAALEVLVRAGRRSERWLDALGARAAELEPEARALLARALHASGRTEAARAALPSRAPAPRGVRERGGTLRSDLRAQSQWLLSAAALGVSPEQRSEVLLHLCGALRGGALASTQELAFVLRAVAAEAAAAPPPSGASATVELRIENVATRRFELVPGRRERVVFDLPREAIVELRAAGGPVYAAWMLRGFPMEGASVERNDGLRVERRWLDRAGRPLEGGVGAGDLILVELAFESHEACANAIAVDPLPAGFEIENERLATRDAAVAGLEWERGAAALEPQRIERLADRLVLFADLPRGRSVLRYALRAVQPGSFLRAPLEVEAAYDARCGARTGGGRVEVRR